MMDASLHLPAAFLHEAFSDRSGVPPDHFELYYRGKRLEGEAALARWGIVKGSTIEVKTRGRGGAPEATYADEDALRAVGEGDGGAASASNSVMVSLKAPTGNTELVGLGYGSRHLGYGRRHPEVGTLNPERSYAAQGIAKGATLSLIPRLVIGGMELTVQEVTVCKINPEA